MSEVSELEQERLQSAKLCNDNALLRDAWCRLQQDYQNLKNAHTTLQSKLTEMCEVLQWASENVVSVEFDGRDGQWIVQRDDCDDHYAPTLYDALHKAWEGRDR